MSQAETLDSQLAPKLFNLIEKVLAYLPSLLVRSACESRVIRSLKADLSLRWLTLKLIQMLDFWTST